MTHLAAGGPWLIVSDDRVAPRWYATDVTLVADRVLVGVGAPVLASRPAPAEGTSRRPTGASLATSRPAPAEGTPHYLDLEAIVGLPGGELLVSSEGGLVDGVRRPASVMRYGADGRYIGAVTLPARFLPSTAASGLRDNLGFEGMETAADGSRVWLLAEAPLLQDDIPAGIDNGARTRLLELVADASQTAGFRARREFVYEIEPSGLPAQLGPAAALADQGPVAMTRLPAGDLLVMERAYLYDADLGRGANVIRIFTIDLEGADDVSEAASLRDVPAARPVVKRLLVDLAELAPPLDPRLRTLANFEGMAPGPPTPDGRPTLVLVSDDNFSDDQTMAIVVLRLECPPSTSLGRLGLHRARVTVPASPVTPARR